MRKIDKKFFEDFGRICVLVIPGFVLMIASVVMIFVSDMLFCWIVGAEYWGIEERCFDDWVLPIVVCLPVMIIGCMAYVVLAWISKQRKAYLRLGCVQIKIPTLVVFALGLVVAAIIIANSNKLENIYYTISVCRLLAEGYLAQLVIWWLADNIW